jgi:predicted short-subunit dehydrogenase-like oxidoreductase (DUF2520 family)
MDPTAALPHPPYRVALAGAGRVGTAVAATLVRRGHVVTAIASKTPRSAGRAAELLRAPVVDFEAVASGADIVLIGAGDDAIAEVGARVSPALESPVAVCHFAGALGIEPLHSVAARGALACALHPVQSFPDIETALAHLPGSAWGVTTEPGGEAWAARFVTNDLEGFPVQVREADRALWHAAAVMTSNGIAALMSAAESVLAGIDVAEPLAVLGPLASGTLDNVRAAGHAGEVLTGPVVRGDVDIIQRHLHHLRERAPETLYSYRLISLTIIEAARRAGRLDDAAAAAMTAAMEAA